MEQATEQPVKPKLEPAAVTHRHGTGLELALAFIDNRINNTRLTDDQVAVLDALSQDIHDAMGKAGFEMQGNQMVVIPQKMVAGKPAQPLSFSPPPPVTATPGIPKAKVKSINEQALEAMNAKAQQARRTHTGGHARCPNCAKSFIKHYHGTIFCSNEGAGNCKDAFHRQVKSLRLAISQGH